MMKLIVGAITKAPTFILIVVFVLTNNYYDE